MLAVLEGRGGGGLDSHIKRMGVLIPNFEMNPQGYQDPVLRPWLEYLSAP